MLLACAAPALAAVELTKHDPGVTIEFPFTADEWFSDSAHRAFLSLLLVMLYTAAEELPEEIDPSDFLVNTSYVGKNGDEVCFFGADGTYLLLIVFNTYEGVFYCGVKEYTEETIEDELLDIVMSYCLEGYVENSVEDILSCAEGISIANSALHAQ